MPARVKVNNAALSKPEAVSGTITFDGTEKTGVKIPFGADPFNYCWTGESGDPEDTGISQPFKLITIPPFK